MVRFKWFPSFYIIFVAPPGVVSKTTTADIAISLLREVPGINFGPEIITWPALVVAFSRANECFEYAGEYWPMSAMTLCSGELGNLLDLSDQAMLNLYITLWDGAKKLDKETKGSGSESIDAPWINMIGCTTPHWLADNMPLAAIGGGFTSRCIFVYADHKEKYVPYVDETITSATDATVREALISDLTHIATTLVGPYTILKEARLWGRSWYQNVWEVEAPNMTSQMMEGYVARKQTYLHKLAMIISASRSDEMEITLQDLQLADLMLKEVEPDMNRVFSRVGKAPQVRNVETLLAYVKKKGVIAYDDVYTQLHMLYPQTKDFDSIISGCIRSGKLGMTQTGGKIMLNWVSD